MTLFSRACMTAIALAVLSLPLAAVPAAEARDRNEGGGQRNFSSHSTSRIDARHNDWRRRHHSRNDRDRPRDDIARARSTSSEAWTLRNADRWDWNRNHHIRRDWRHEGSRSFAGPAWRRDGDVWRGSARPYYRGPAHPYYAGQDDDRRGLGNNVYGGSVSAYEDPGNGNYFYFDEFYDGMGDTSGGFSRAVQPRTGLKVIAVTPDTASASCSWEAGVCVIRP